MGVKRVGEVLTLEGLENVRIFIGKIEGEEEELSLIHI